MIKNIISSFFTRGAVAAINLLILLISSKQLGGEIIGQVTVMILNITIIQIVNEIYTGYSLVHFIARFSLKKIYTTGLLWTVICIAILNGVFILLNIGGIKALWLHVALLSFMGTLNSFHCVMLLAKQNIKAYNFLVFFQPAVLLIVLCCQVFVLGNRSVEAYVFSMYVSFSLALLASVFFVLRLLSRQHKQNNEPRFKAMLKNGFINQAGNLAHTLSNRYNFYLIGSTLLIGVFSRASALIESVWLVGASITPLVLTRVANQDNDSANGRITFMLSKISLVLSLLCIIFVLCLPQNFFVFLLGSDFSDVKMLMLYLSPGVLCISFSTVISHHFSGKGEQKVQLLANCLGLLVTMCTAPYLISRYGLTGACYAASLSYFMQSLVLTIVFMRHNGFHFRLLFSFKKDLDLLRK